MKQVKIKSTYDAEYALAQALGCSLDRARDALRRVIPHLKIELVNDTADSVPPVQRSGAPEQAERMQSDAETVQQLYAALPTSDPEGLIKSAERVNRIAELNRRDIEEATRLLGKTHLMEALSRVLNILRRAEGEDAP